MFFDKKNIKKRNFSFIIIKYNYFLIKKKILFIIFIPFHYGI